MGVGSAGNNSWMQLPDTFAACDHCLHVIILGFSALHIAVASSLCEPSRWCGGDQAYIHKEVAAFYAWRVVMVA